MIEIKENIKNDFCIRPFIYFKSLQKKSKFKFYNKNKEKTKIYTMYNFKIHLIIWEGR